MTRSNAMLCDRNRSTLVMVDIQSKLLAVMGADDRVQVLNSSKLLLASARHLEVPVLVTEQYPKGLGPTATSLTGALPEATPVFDKTCFSSCGASGFSAAIADDRDQVVLFGIEAHVCLLQTAMDLMQQGRQVFVVADATCSRNPAHRDNALARLRAAGVIVTNSESVMFEWLRDASHEQFRTLSALIK